VCGSVYLGLRNSCGAGLTHVDLDRPLTIAGGVQKGSIGFFKEAYIGIAGLYTVPAQRLEC
jgi:hypothetical protein